MAEEIKAFTKELLESVILSISQPVEAPCVMLMSSYGKSVFTMFQTADEEVWNWRRTKRELRRLGLKRKGVRRPYHKRALDG